MIQLLMDMDTQTVDLQRPDGTLIYTDETLETAVLISLFTRRLAEPTDVLPEPNSHREGWWADPYADVAGHKLGSRLWLLRRAKTTRSTLNLARAYASEALQWMIEDGIAASINVEVERQNGSRLAFKAEIIKPTQPASKWIGVWQAHLAEL